MILYVVSLRLVLNKNKALERAKEIVSQKSSPKELDPKEVDSILLALEFEDRGKNSNHTTYRYYHHALENEGALFLYGNLKVSVGHSKKSKSVVRIDSVRKIIKALEIILESENS